MAGTIHDDASLAEIQADLATMGKRLQAVRELLQQAGVKEISVDGERGQVNGRTDILAFINQAETSARRAKDKKRLNGT